MGNYAYMQMLDLKIPIKDYQRFEEGAVWDLDKNIQEISEEHNQPEIYSEFKSNQLLACMTGGDFYGKMISTNRNPQTGIQTIYSLIETFENQEKDMFHLAHEEYHATYYFKGVSILERAIINSGFKLNGSLLVLGEEDAANLCASWLFLKDGWTKKEAISNLYLPNPKCLDFLI